MAKIELIKEDDWNYYLIKDNNRIKIDVTKGYGCNDCRAINQALMEISSDPKIINIFGGIFANPHKLSEFKTHLVDSKYDHEWHKRDIIELAELFDGIIQEYFIEAIIKHVTWVNGNDYWDICHLTFEKRIVPELKNLLIKAKAKDTKSKSKFNNFSQRQIAISYFIMGISINSENAKEILEKHSQTKSTQKLLQKRITKSSELTALSHNKTTDSKHLEDLLQAKRLLDGIKDKETKTDLQAIINEFKSAFENNY